MTKEELMKALDELEEQAISDIEDKEEQLRTKRLQLKL
ncbi:hypothetical protein SORDD14_01169 [Streptococcus oralis]|uniref:Uncharacterized protein n=1 Tax=Streptococcus oralis TaxID=1303 RepID=A0A139P0V9_STROR|nr:hypothetical protein SORDD14_01169 [Streptococcus oralis]